MHAHVCACFRASFAVYCLVTWVIFTIQTHSGLHCLVTSFTIESITVTRILTNQRALGSLMAGRPPCAFHFVGDAPPGKNPSNIAPLEFVLRPQATGGELTGRAAGGPLGPRGP